MPITSRDLSHRLRHESSVRAHLCIAHFAFDLGAWRECSDGIDDNDIERRRANKLLENIERLLAEFWLGENQLFDVDAKTLRIANIERMFGIDKGRVAAALLGFSDDVQAKRCFAG